MTVAAGFYAPHPFASQLIDSLEREVTVTSFAFAQLGKSLLCNATEWSPGETTKVKGVTLPLERLSIVIMAPGGVDVTDSLPGGLGPLK